MYKLLKDVVAYSKDRIDVELVTIDNYVTTDNLLQNKAGKVRAEKMPAITGKITKYGSGDILVANIRPYLKKLWFSDTSGGSSADVLTLKVKEGYNPKFIYYSIFRDDFFTHVMNGSKGTKMPRGDKRQILDFSIPDFPKLEQDQIAKVLSDLDAKIDLNNRINSELEEMAKLIYDYWFVQFDFPISEAQAAVMGRPELKGKPYKSSGGKMVWNKELKRDVPEGWEVKQLKEFAQIKKGTLITEKTADLSGNVKVVAAGLNYSYFHSISNFDANTITLSASGANAGHINFWRQPIFASDCTTVRGATVSQTIFLLHFLKIRQDYIYNQARGSAQPHVYPKDIEVLDIVIPPLELIEEYGQIVVPTNDMIRNNEEQNMELTNLRDWLLPMLMNGQVRVMGEAEEMKMAAEPGGIYEVKDKE